MNGKQFYTVVKLSKNRYLDNDGSLICKNAILGKAGTQAYHSSELGMDGNKIIMVHRTEDEVFNEQSLASLEGKALTLYHPNEDVNVHNMKDTMKGIILRVKRDGKLIVGDIKVFDKEAIELITNNEMVELSLGYDTKLIRDSEGRILQTEIVYNHVALVPKGRAEVARIIDSVLGTASIRDKQFEEEEVALEKQNTGFISKVLEALGMKKVEDKEDLWTLSATDSASNVEEEPKPENEKVSEDTEAKVKDSENASEEPKTEDVVEDKSKMEDEKLDDAIHKTKVERTYKEERSFNDETGEEKVTTVETGDVTKKTEGEFNTGYSDEKPKENEKITDEKGDAEMTEFEKLISKAQEIEKISDPEMKKQLQDALFSEFKTKEDKEEDLLDNFANIKLDDSEKIERFDFEKEIKSMYDSLNPDNFDSYEAWVKHRKQLDKEARKESIEEDLKVVFGGRY